MNMAKYYTLVTDVGRAKMANAQVMGQKVSFSQIALGSSETKPRENQTALGKEEWRGPISNVSLDKDNPNWIVVEAVVPSHVGGFEIAEVGVYDEEGHLIVVGNHPKTYKPKMDEGTTKDVAIRIIIEVSNSEIVELKVNPSVVIATRSYVESAIELAMASIDFSTVEKQIDQHVSNADIHVTAKDKSNWNAKETPSAAQAKATKALNDAKVYTDTHEQRTDNPHKVTKSQVGLSNVDNVKQASKVDLDSHINDAVKHVTASERASWNAKETPEGAQAKANEALKQAKQHAEQIGENVLKDAKAYTQESASTLDLSNNPQMQSVQELAQQAFQSGNKVKKDLIDALLSKDNSLSISEKDDFEKIIGILKESSVMYSYARGSQTSGNSAVEIRGLKFTPDLVIYEYRGSSGASYNRAGIFWRSRPSLIHRGDIPRGVHVQGSGGTGGWNTISGGSTQIVESGFDVSEPRLSTINTFEWEAYRIGGLKL